MTSFAATPPSSPDTPANPPQPLVAFGAHPDDLEFGAGGILAVETSAGRPVHCVVCSRGEAGTSGTPAQRSAEAIAGAAQLGATLEFIDLGGDAHFEDTLTNALTLAALLRRLRPAVVLAPSPGGNQHPDHACLGRLLRHAARLARYGGVGELQPAPPHSIETLLHYVVTTDDEALDARALFIDISPEVTRWTAAMHAHVSQSATRDYVELQLTRARLLGLRAGVAYAQALWPADPLLFPSLAALGRGARRF